MAFYLTTHESLENGLRRIALERLAQSTDKLTTLPDGQQKAVHDTRKNFKRVRAVLRLMRDALGEETFQQQNGYFRDASRLLAPIRDSAVMVETVDIVTTDEAEFAAIRQALVDRHEAISQQLLDEEKVIERVVTLIENGRSALESLSVQPNDFATIAPSLRRVYRRGRKRMGLAYEHPNDPEGFHDWRKRVKYLWYHLEILRPVWPSLCQVLIEDLHHVSDYLGDAHDMAELMHVLHKEAETFAELDGYALLLERLQAKHHALNSEAISLGDRLFAETPKQFVARFDVYWQVWRADVAAERPFAQQPIVPATKQPQPDVLLSTREVADKLSLSMSEVRQLIKDGRLPAHKVGNQWIVFANTLPEVILPNQK